jgi:proteasome lid subunit RPN8/RPN11
MVLHVTQQQLDILAVHAKSAFPEECCGLLVGRLLPSPQLVEVHLVEIHPTKNTWTAAMVDPSDSVHSQRDRYSIDPTAILSVLKQARCRHLEIIGIYHSHPDHAAIPSECDRELAWPQYIYVIMAVNQDGVYACRAWQLDESQRFQAVALQISS